MYLVWNGCVMNFPNFLPGSFPFLPGGSMDEYVAAKCAQSFANSEEAETTKDLEKTMTRWINLQLKDEGMQVTDLYKDTRVGKIPIKLLEKVTSQKLPKPNAGKIRVQCLDNLGIAVTVLKSHGLGLDDLTPWNISEANNSVIDFIHHIVVLDTNFMLFQQTRRNLALFRELKQYLLDWIRYQVSTYPDIKTISFKRPSWTDGLLFNALIHSYHEDLFDFNDLLTKSSSQRLNHAFQTASKLGIASILNMDDSPTGVNSETSIFIYLTLFYKTLVQSCHRTYRQATDSIELFNKPVNPLVSPQNVVTDSNTDEEESRAMEDLDKAYMHAKGLIEATKGDIERQYKADMSISESISLQVAIAAATDQGQKLLDNFTSKADALKNRYPVHLYRIAAQQTAIANFWKEIKAKINDIYLITKCMQSIAVCDLSAEVKQEILKMSRYFDQLEDPNDLTKLKELFQTHKERQKKNNVVQKLQEMKDMQNRIHLNPDLVQHIPSEIRKFEAICGDLDQFWFAKQLWLQQCLEVQMFQEEAEALKTGNYDAFRPMGSAQDTTNTVRCFIKSRWDVLIKLDTDEERFDAFVKLKDELMTKENFPTERVLEIYDQASKARAEKLRKGLLITKRSSVQIKREDSSERPEEATRTDATMIADNTHEQSVNELIASLPLLATGDDLATQPPQSRKSMIALQFFEDHYPREAFQFRSIFDNVTMDTKPLKVAVQAAENFVCHRGKVPTYETTSRKRGAVLIINNNDFQDYDNKRKGSEIDVENLQELFRQFHMAVKTHQNLDQPEFVDAVAAFAKNREMLQDVDMCFVVVMSHGSESEGTTDIECSDGLSVTTAWIEAQFSNVRCPLLEKKPKIFVYQVCRGFKMDCVRTKEDSTFQRRWDNVLVAHSTLPEYKSHRDIYLGSWYIQLICEVFMQHAHDTHVEELFKIVDSKLAELKSEKHTMQTSNYWNVGFKNCYIHPGIYLEDSRLKRF